MTSEVKDARGLWGLPLVGHVAFPPIPSESKVKSLRKKYGDIFMIRIGTSINVFLCRFDLCKEACAKAEFTNRPCWYIFNMISKGVNSDTRYEIGDASSKKFHELISEVQKCFDRISIPDFFPWLTKIFPVCVQKKVFAYKVMMDLRNQICTFFKEIIDNHKATLDPANPRDYIDAYLLEMEDSKDEPKSTFTGHKRRTKSHLQSQASFFWTVLMHLD
ncbi:cytochrome P450 2L1-like [Oratosquilla oratoria]|uniref:cytochrome P450 2L1-like n=1 Tax=Oratosquilla oratoria TaxID=337810 RepID=UPI003F75BCE6